MTEEETKKEFDHERELGWLGEALKRVIKENNNNLEDNNIKEETMEEKLHKSYIEELDEIPRFFREFRQLSEFMIEYLKKKYGHLACDMENFLWMLDGDIFVQRTEEIEKIFQKAINLSLDHYKNHIENHFKSIENKLNLLINQKNIHLLERFLQQLLIKFPQIIESNLKFIKEEYNLGDTQYRGDLLFLDSNSKQLNIELKVIVPSFREFEEQLSNYLKNIQNNERLMYIAPRLTSEQKSFCNDNNIEFKIIDLDELFN